MADDGEPGRVDGENSPHDDLPQGDSTRSSSFLARLWPLLPASTRRPERLAALILGLGVVLVGLWKGSLAVRDWLHAQPVRQLPFQDVTLEPAPPSYIKFGQSGLLAQIRERAHLPERISVLDLDLGELARTFTLHEPWIRSVDEIEIRYPNQLIVRVTYREPVAEAKLARAGRVVLDREGVVLETSELDPVASGSLITITGLDRPETPLDPKVGVSLGEPGSEVEARVAASVKLADFLRHQTRGGPDHPRSPIAFDQISALFGAQKLSARTTEGLWVHWGSAPGSESETEPSALAKWSMLTERLARPEDRIPKSPNDLLVFTRDGARLIQGVRKRPEFSQSRVIGGES